MSKLIKKLISVRRGGKTYQRVQMVAVPKTPLERVQRGVPHKYPNSLHPMEGNPNEILAKLRNPETPDHELRRLAMAEPGNTRNVNNYGPEHTRFMKDLHESVMSNPNTSLHTANAMLEWRDELFNE